MQRSQMVDAELLAIFKEIAPNRYEREKRKAEFEELSREPIGFSMRDTKKASTPQPA